MAIVNPVREDRRTMQTATIERFIGPLSSKLNIDFDDTRLPTTATRNTEPLVEVDISLDEDEEPSTLLDEEELETTEADTIVARSPRQREGGITGTKHASGSEDAFQSYLHDIRRHGLITH